MPELLRSIANRLRELVGNRRMAPRYRVRLEATLVLNGSSSQTRQNGNGAKRVLKLSGYTRDISKTGLGLIVPAMQIGGRHIMSGDSTLLLVLKLKAEAVEMRVKAVRYNPQEEGSAETGYLIGAQIVQMEDGSRSRFDTYIDSLKSRA